MRNIELQAKKEEFSKRFFLSILFFLLLKTMFWAGAYYYRELPSLIPLYLNIALSFMVIYTGFLLRKAKFNFRTVLSAALIIFFIVFTYLSLLFCDVSNTIRLYYFPLVALFLMLTSLKKAVVFTFFLLILCLFLPLISSALGLALDSNVFKDHYIVFMFEEYTAVVVSVYFTFFIIYYIIKFVEIKNNFSNLENTDYYKEQGSSVVNYLNKKLKKNPEDSIYDKKLILLYDHIITLFNEEKPFLNSDFNIRVLAEKVSSNTSYVSAALNKIGNKKFNQLVNEYRIDQIKKEMNENMHDKFTIEHIYTRAGFSSQSTFNRVFKEQTNFTPSEYIENLQRIS